MQGLSLLRKEKSLRARTKEKTCTALVADETASVNFQMWGPECEAFQPGDVIRISKGIFSRHKNKLLLRAGRRGAVEKVGEYTMLFVESPNMSEMRFVPDVNHPSKLVPELQVPKPW
jgi:ssDNA-binding replication factor A large subunit